MDKDATVRGVRISHPERVLYPADGISKLEVAKYYDTIADWMVPHARGRPLTLVHCPTGIGDCRYLRHVKVWGPLALRRVKIQEQTKVGEYLVADTPEALISLAQIDVLEIHTWNSRIERVEQPDRVIFDLDPGHAVTWIQVIDAARLVRRVLRALRLESWVKTTGGRGLHVVVPLKPERTWSECLAFARGVAHIIERDDPARFTTRYRKAGREQQILIDYLRNNRTNTSIAAFSTRSRPGAPVSIPIAWEELTPRLKPERQTLRTVPRRFKRLRVDPWRDYWKCTQRLSSAVLKAVGAGR